MNKMVIQIRMKRTKKYNLKWANQNKRDYKNIEDVK